METTWFLNGKKISDKISTKVLLNNINMLSANQINAQIKLLEFWKSNITMGSKLSISHAEAKLWLK